MVIKQHQRLYCGKVIAEHQLKIHQSVALEYEGMNLSKKEQVRKKKTKPDELVVLWTSGDKEVALKMAFMYTFYPERFKLGFFDLE